MLNDIRSGLYFSFDALIAATVVFFALATVMQMDAPDQTSSVSTTYQRADTSAEDAIQLAMQSALRNAVPAAEREELVNDTVLEEDDLDSSVMDGIAILWASNETAAARDLARDFFSGLVPEDFEYRVRLAEGGGAVIYNSSGTFDSSSLVARATRMVSGVSRNRPTRGFTAQASLTDLGAIKSEYFFFGGYVGDGDITANITLPEYRNVVATELEGDFGGDFNLSINGVDAGSYDPSASNLSADTFTVCNLTVATDRCAAIEEGDNEIVFDFTGNGTSIGGGFVRVDYNQSDSLESRSGTYRTSRERFPGIDGIINVFSSFHVPGTLRGISGRLHYWTNSTLFLEIGNTTVYRNTSGGGTDIRLDNETLAGALHEANVSLAQFSNETIPFRLGVENISQIRREEVDAVSVIDVSGSMGDDPDNDGTTLLDEAKNASKTFTDVILNVSRNRVGMVSYESEVDTVRALSYEGGPVKSTIDSLSYGGNTCTGCGILEAIEVLQDPVYRWVISPKERWRWNASFPETEPPTRDGREWTEVGYNDSDWGYNRTIAGIGDVDTTLPDSGGDYYFRKEFQWDWLDYSAVKAFVRSDDAAEVYINGQLVDNDTDDHEGRYWNRWLNDINPSFTDSHESGALGPNWTVTSGTAGGEVLTGSACGATDGDQAMILRWGSATVRTDTFDMADRESLTLNYDMKQGGGGDCDPPQSNNDEDIYVEYLDADGTWQELKMHAAGGTDPSSGTWQEYSLEIPADGLHDGFQLRYRFPSGSGDLGDYDYWALDDVRLGESRSFDESVIRDGNNVIAVRLKDDNETSTVSWRTETTDEWEAGSFTETRASDGDLTLSGRATLFEDGFEDGALSPWSCAGSGTCEVTTSCATEGSYTAAHRGGEGSIVSPAQDLSGEAGANITYWVRKGGSCSAPPVDGEDLAVEYLDSGGSWQQLELIEAADLADGEIVEREVSLPADALHQDFEIRFRQTTYQGYWWLEEGRWHVDEVAVESTAFNVTEGSYTSRLFDAGQEVSWQSVDVTASTPAGTSYTLDYSDGDDWYDTLSDVPATPSIRFNASLETDDLAVGPSIDAVDLSYAGKKVEFDFGVNATVKRNRSMIVMSDGVANRETSMDVDTDHNNDNRTDALDHTIEAACRAWENHSIRVYVVGFGSGADEDTLQRTADCGNGQYFFASTGELADIFREISQSILEASERGQQFLLQSGTINDTLFADSSLTLNYTSPRGLDFGRFRISQQSPRFGGDVTSPKNGSFDVPAETTLADARLLSYSSNYWTDRVTIENSTGQHEYVFRLDEYGSDYEDLGDPYNVHLPPSKATIGAQNNVSVNTALGPNTSIGGSNFSRVVYDLYVDGFVGYGEVFNKSEGGTRTVTTDYGSFELEVGNASDQWEPNGDATDNATERLLNKLDVDDDGSVDFQIDSDNLNIGQNSLSGLKWLWGPAIVSVEVWEE